MLPTPLRIPTRAAETGQIHLRAARAVHQELIRTLHTLPATIHRVRTRRSREGPNEFVITGIHKDYDITSQLPEVSVPTLFTCGRFDETRPEEAAWYQSLVLGSELLIFEQSAHVAHLEERELYLQVLREFLQRHADN